MVIAATGIGLVKCSLQIARKHIAQKGVVVITIHAPGVILFGAQVYFIEFGNPFIAKQRILKF